MPWSLKYSAMAVARQAPLTRISGDWSAGVAITMARFNPSGPSVSSTKSLTSLPRSPTNATTITSAWVLRVNMPNKVLLPTPEPANSPKRWPLPMVVSALIARTPTSSGSVIASRSRGLSASPLNAVLLSDSSSPPPSIKRPAPSSTRPSISSPTATAFSSSIGTTGAPIARPSTFASGISTKCPSENPTTSAMMLRSCATRI